MPKLLMLTGQRLSEVAEMQDDELLDLNGKDPRWIIPGTRTKNSKEHVVPLGPTAVKALRTIPRLRNCPFVFSTTGTTPISGFTNLKKRIDTQIEKQKKEQPSIFAGQFSKPWRFHDLRRTFKTGLAELGVSPDVRDALVNHTPQGVAAHYDHGEYNALKREAMLRWEQHIQNLIDGNARRDRTAKVK
jgi:integrase